VRCNGAVGLLSPAHEAVELGLQGPQLLVCVPAIGGMLWCFTASLTLLQDHSLLLSGSSSAAPVQQSWWATL
jgi:hypothetical protein